MSLILLRAAQRGLRTMPAREQRQLLGRLQAIAADPDARHPGVLTMQGEPPGRLRVRQGDWRAILVVQDGDTIVTDVAHRREAYR